MLIAKEKKALFNEIMDKAKEEGMDKGDVLLKNSSAEEKKRIVMSRIEKLATPEEKKAYLLDLYKQGILTANDFKKWNQ